VTADEFTGYLRARGVDVSQRSGEHWASCPVHDDPNPSVSWRDDGAKVLLTCRAGCQTPAVLAAWDLTMADLFHRPAKSREPEAIYHYVDEQGAPLFEVARFASKRFAQRTPDGNWKLGDTRRVLYHLPRVIEAVRTGQLVYVVEGEKDVHAIEAAGKVATCNPGGAGNWAGKYCANYVEPLRGAMVVVVADRDKAGYKHAREVAASLEAVEARISIVEAVEGKDASDHLAAGHSVNAFNPVVERSEPSEPKVTSVESKAVRGSLTISAAAVQSHVIEWLWLGRLAFGYITVTTGFEKVGKSVFWVWAIAQLTNGKLTDDGEPIDVLIVAREDGIEDMWKPRLALAGADMKRCYFLRFEELGADWNLRDGNALTRVAIKETNARLVLIDAVLEHMPEPRGGESVNSPVFVRRVLTPLRELLREMKLACVISLHPSKGANPAGEFRDMVQTSQAWMAVSRLGLLVTWHPADMELEQESRRRVVLRGPSNIGRDPGALEFSITGRMHTHDDGKTQERELADDVKPSAITYRDLATITAPSDDDSKVARAMAIMRVLLSDGEWHPSKDVYAVLNAAELGGRSTVSAAKRAAGIETRKVGFKDGIWQWRAKSTEREERSLRDLAHAGSISDGQIDKIKTFPSPNNHEGTEGNDRSGGVGSELSDLSMGDAPRAPRARAREGEEGTLLPLPDRTGGRDMTPPPPYRPDGNIDEDDDPEGDE
jgi:hypothetical protein